MARPTLEELFDRLEIDELLTRYATAIDTKTFDLLDEVFTPDAHVDYTSAGGIAGDFPTVKAWLAEVLPHFPEYQHVVGNRDVTVDGDTATSISKFFNPMVSERRRRSSAAASTTTSSSATADGWRIAERFEQTIWTYGAVPAVPARSRGSAGRARAARSGAHQSRTEARSTAPSACAVDVSRLRTCAGV